MQNRWLNSLRSFGLIKWGMMALAWCLMGYHFSSALGLDFAVGPSFSWEVRKDYGTTKRNNFIPEIVGNGYWDVSGNRSQPGPFFLRSALRLGYSGILQADQPKQIRFVETDYLGNVELAALYDFYVIPVVGFGAGLKYRTIRAKFGDKFVSDSGPSLNHDETLGFGYIMFGLGIPYFRSAMVIEPFVRYEITQSDKRSVLRFGLDFTFGD